MLIEEMTDIIAEEIAKNQEYQRLLKINWNQRLLTIKVDEDGYPDEDGLYTRFVKIMADPYIGLSLDDALDPSKCYFCCNMPLTLDKAVRNGYFLAEHYTQESLLLSIEDFFFELQCLEHCKTYEEFELDTGLGEFFDSVFTGGASIPCAFTG